MKTACRPLLLYVCRDFGNGVTTLLIAQMKAINSRAIAVATTCFGFPLPDNLLKRSHNRSWAFQAIALTALGNC